MELKAVNHIAVITGDLDRSLRFYTEVLGFTVLRHVYREERRSHKVDLALDGTYLIELFTFPDAPPRPSYPEAKGLRHLAFSVERLDDCIRELEAKGVQVEPVRTDPYTGCRCTFFADPDGLPLELVETGGCGR